MKNEIQLILEEIKNIEESKNTERITQDKIAKICEKHGTTFEEFRNSVLKILADEIGISLDELERLSFKEISEEDLMNVSGGASKMQRIAAASLATLLGCNTFVNPHAMNRRSQHNASSPSKSYVKSPKFEFLYKTERQAEIYNQLKTGNPHLCRICMTEECFRALLDSFKKITTVYIIASVSRKDGKVTDILLHTNTIDESMDIKALNPYFSFELNTSVFTNMNIDNGLSRWIVDRLNAAYSSASQSTLPKPKTQQQQPQGFNQQQQQSDDDIDSQSDDDFLLRLYDDIDSQSDDDTDSQFYDGFFPRLGYNFGDSQPGNYYVPPLPQQPQQGFFIPQWPQQQPQQ